MRRIKLFFVFGFILLLSLSFVSAGLFDWFKGTGKVIESDWTQWFDIDGPGGRGDYELLANENIGPNVCENPLEIECQTTTGLNYLETGENINIDLERGCWCINSEQLDGVCNYDYEVRFNCGDEVVEEECLNFPNPLSFCPDGEIIVIGVDNNGCSIYDCSEEIVDEINETWCNDSDGGLNYYEKGTLNDSYYFSDGEQKLFEDSCTSKEINEDNSITYHYSYSGDFLAEYSCNNHQGADFYECPHGCEDGACTEEVIIDGCFDSDGGLNYFIRGEVLDKGEFSSIDTDSPSPITGNPYFTLISPTVAILHLADKNLSVTEGNNYVYRGIYFQIKAIVQNYYNQTFSVMEIQTLSYKDECLDENILIEYNCVGDSFYANGQIESTGPLFFESVSILAPYLTECENGCEDGACIGENQTNSFCEMNTNNIIDGKTCYLYEDEVLKNSFGTAQYYISLDDVDVEGVDLRLGYYEQETLSFDFLVGEIYDLNPDFSLEVSIKKVSEDFSYIVFEARDFFEEVCDSGCILNNECYSYGYRKNNQYCSEHFSEFVNFKLVNYDCTNSFECSSNLCIDGNCVATSTWQKFMLWFNRLFGGNEEEIVNESNITIYRRDLGVLD